MLSRLFHRSSKTIFDVTHNLTDEQYYQLMIKSVQEPTFEGVQMPGFPEEIVQKQFVGLANEQALNEVYNFYKIVKQYCQSLGKEIQPSTRIIDFGCGWGRIIRLFFKDIRSENIFGLDVDPDMISFCSKSMGSGRYEIVNPEPPTNFQDNSIDVIFAYSVFSHLAQPIAIKWIKEFSRILKPKGVVLATTQARYFFDYIETLKGKELDSAWQKTIVKAFEPIEEARRKYDEGQFIYVPTGGGGVRTNDYYGEALIPKKFAEEELGKYLRLIDYLMDQSVLPQALMVMQKNA